MGQNTFNKKKHISEVLSLFEKRTKANKTKYNTNHKRIIEIFDDKIAKHTYLFFSIKKNNESEKKGNRAFYLPQYLCAIANNYYALKEVFQKGLQVQVLVLLRNQFELINALISFITDDNYFDCVTKFIEQKDSLISPDNKNSKKIVKEILKKMSKETIGENWKDYNTKYDSLYHLLSEPAHGNLLKVSMFSFFIDENKEGVLYPAIGGGFKPMGKAIEILMDTLDYFDLAFIIILGELIKKNYCDKKSESYKTLIQLMK